MSRLLGLAPNLVEMIFEKILELNKTINLTILLVEQNANAALGLADRGYVIETGNILFQDSASKLLKTRDIQKAYLGL